MHPELTIDWYEQLLRDIKQRFPQINVHGFSPPEIDHIATVSGLSIREVLVRLKEAGLGTLARRRGGNPRRPGPPGSEPVQSVGRPLAGGLPHLARPGRTRLGHHDVRPRRDAGRSDRTPGAVAQAAGRDARLHRLHLLDVSAGQHGLGAICPSSGLRVPQDAGRQPAVSRQFRQSSGQLGHAGAGRSASWPCGSGPTISAA